MKTLSHAFLIPLLLVTSSLASTVAVAVNQDLLVAYTQASCDYSGSCAQLEADIETVVVRLNQAYRSSGINVNSRLVGFHKFQYEYTKNKHGLDVRGKNNDSTGSDTGNRLDVIHSVRDSLGADMVVFIHPTSRCGTAGVGPNETTALATVRSSCLMSQPSMEHEIGHMQGLLHARDQHSGGQLGQYNYGYRRCTQTHSPPHFSTIMGYGCGGDGWIYHFSTPEKDYKGVQRGVDHRVDPNNGAWASRAINDTAEEVAGFRSGALVDLPAAPSDLSAMVFGGILLLTWKDNAATEESMVVERSLDANNWSIITTRPADTTVFIDNSLSDGQDYYYRVYAQNSAGPSTYSNVFHHGVELSVVTSGFTVGKTTHSVSSRWFTVDAALPEENPAVVAQMQTAKGIDASTLRMQGLNSNGFQVFVEEEQSKDGERSHTSEVVGYVGFPEGSIKDASGRIIGVAGTKRHDQTFYTHWHTLDYGRSINNPVVIMAINTYQDQEPVFIRIKDVSRARADYQLQEWDYLDGKHGIETISYIVLESGSHLLANNKKLSVGKKASVKNKWETISYPSVGSNPVALTQAQTARYSSATLWGVNATSLVTRMRSITSSNLQVLLQRQEKDDGKTFYGQEDVGYIVVGDN